MTTTDPERQNERGSNRDATSGRQERAALVKLDEGILE